jgi:phosphohistidine phosphatase SixA
MRAGPLALLALAGLLATAPVRALNPPAAAASASPAPRPPVAPVATLAAFEERPLTPAVLARLRAGGLVLYLRHGLTDNRIPDRQPAVDLADCGTQRPLTAEGRQQFVIVGAALHRLGVPVGDVHSSPMCRALESARAAFGERVQVERDLMASSNQTAAQKRPILARTQALLSDPVPAGSNRVVVAHAPNLADLMGYFPAEATLAVFEPRGAAGFTYLASVPVGQWRGLAR